MEAGQLTGLAQQYQKLYNFRNPNYSNKQRRENIWEKTGQLMKQAGKVG
jgi:hypothetical protein